MAHNECNEIKQFRQKFAITQEKLAKKIGINPRSIRWWESGKVKPHRLFWERFLQIKERYERKEKKETHG